MKRRLFVGKAIVGLSLPFVPNALLAATSATTQPVDAFVDQVARSIRQGSLGSIQRVTISHVYDPKRLNRNELLTHAQKAIALVRQLTNLSLNVDPGSQLAEAPQHSFASESTQSVIGDTIVTWQALSCNTLQSNSFSGHLCITGSAGILHAYLDGSSYQITDLQGTKLVTKGKSNMTAKIPSVRHRFLTPA